MAIEAIKQIQEVEAEARTLIEKAQENAKALMKEANAKANAEYNNIIKEAKEAAANIIKEATHEGRRKAEPILNDGINEVLSIRASKDENLDKAVNLVIERIVKFNGNR